ncbi:MAG: hypothetical protein V3W18_03675 [candidate division Zixibacteria bacterium]
MESIIISYILPILGVLILLVCVGAFLFPYGEKFKGKIQKIKAFGLVLEVSVITFFVMVGMIFLLLGVYLQMKNYEERLDKAQLDRDNANAALTLAKKMELTAVITLENVGEDNMPKLEDIQCSYYLYGDMTPKRINVIKGYRSDQFKIIFQDISSKAHIAQLVLEDVSTGNKWLKENFMPLEPMYILESGS